MQTIKSKPLMWALPALLLVVAPSVASARAGLGELDATGSAIVMVFFALATCLFPLGFSGTWNFVWYYVWFQPLLLLLAVFLAWRILQKWRVRKLTYFIVLPLIYAAMTFTTNMLSSHFYADHSNYFPKGRMIDRLFDAVNQQGKPNETEIRTALGKPFAEALFPASTSVLPKGMDEYMKTWHLEKSYILSYYEKSRGRKGIEEERTYYIFLDPENLRYVTRSAYYGPAQVSKKWPHKLQP